MIYTKSGNPSAKYAKGRTWKRHMRIEKIARIDVTGIYTIEQIASAMNIAPITVSQIRMTAEYQAKMIELSTGVISEHDKNLRETEENQIAELTSMVPSALLVLRNSLLSKNPSIALRAATEVMDRDGKLAKVSKVDVHHEVIPNLDGATKTSNDIMALLRGTFAQPNANPLDTISAFTVSAADAGQRLKVMSEIVDETTLADIDLSKTRPQ